MKLRITTKKRVIISVILGSALMLPALSTVAQEYTFTPDSGTFTSIRDTGTRVNYQSGFFHDQDNSVSNPISIPFEFYFFGQRLTRLVATADLFLTSNQSLLCAGSGRSACDEPRFSSIDISSSTYNHQGAIYPFWHDVRIGTNSRVLQQLTGVAGDQIRTIEFSQFALTHNSCCGQQDAISVQVKLYERTGVVEFSYLHGSTSSIETTRDRVVVGIAATDNFLPDSSTTRYYTLNNYGSNPTSSSTTFTEITNRSPTRPANGQIYRFTPDLVLPSPVDLTAVTDVAISTVLPQALYPTGAVTYTLTDPSTVLPTGASFSFDPNNRTLSGMSTVSVSPTTLTYTATDGAGNSGSTTFTLRVTTDTNSVTAFSSSASISNITATSGRPISSRTLPQPNAGNPPFTYTFRPSLPRGIVFNQRTRRFYGTPAYALGTTTYTYTATDLDGQSDSLTFTIMIDGIPDFGGASIDAMQFVVGSALDPITLPLAPGGDTPTSYTIMSNLPDGLEFDANTRILSGTPTNSTPNITYTYTATDADGDADSITFTISVAVELLPAYSPLSERLDVRAGLSVSQGYPPPSDFGNLPTRSIVTAAPDPAILGLTTPGSSISGTVSDTAADDTAGPFRYTRTLTDFDGDTASFDYLIYVTDSMPVVPSAIPGAPFYFVPDSAIGTITLPSFGSTLEGTTPTLTYSVENLPDGLMFAPSTRRITGTPTERGEHTITYSATDGGDSATISFVINVEPQGSDRRPLAPTSLSNLVYNRGDSVNVTLPAFTDGDGTLTHSLSDGTNEVTTLVGGLTFDPQTRVVSGNLPVTNMDDSISETLYIYSATDSDASDPDMATTSFTITVTDAVPHYHPRSNSKILEVYAESQVNEQWPNPPSNQQGDAPVRDDRITTNANPILQGISVFAPGSSRAGAITGTVSADTPADDTAGPFVYTSRFLDADGDSATYTITIYLLDPRPVAPIGFGGSVLEYIADEAIIPITLPEFTTTTSQSPSLEYSLSPIPPGMSFDANTRVLSGTPSFIGPMTFTYTATEGSFLLNFRQLSLGADVASVSFTILSIPNSVSFANATIDNIEAIEDSAIQAVTLPAALVNGTTLQYSITPSLPRGISFDANSRVLSGTPTLDQSATTYTYTATAADDSTNSANLTFTIAILEDTMPAYSPVSERVNLILGEMVELSFPTPRRLGNLPITPVTSVPTPALSNLGPVGSQVSGTVFADTTADDTAGPFPYTRTITDTDGDTASFTYLFYVIDDLPIAPSSITAAPFNFPSNVGITPVTLPEFTTSTSQNSPLTYSLSPLPLGLAFDPNTRILSGTPTSGGTSTLTYTASDGGDSASIEFDIVSTPSSTNFFAASIENIDTLVNSPIETVTLPEAFSTRDSISYSITTTLPNGLSFDPDTRELSGTPLTPIGTTNFIYLATDGRVSALLRFSIRVRNDLTPAFSGTTERVEVTPGQSVNRDFPTPTSLGNEPASAENLIPFPALSGIQPSASGTGLMGTVLADTSADDSAGPFPYTHTVTDSNGDSASYTFEIYILDALVVAPVVSDIGYTVNSPLTSVNLPAFTTTTSDNPSLTYSVSGLPTGLNFDANSRTLSGTTSVNARTTVTYTATDGADSASVSFGIVAIPSSLSFVNAAIADIVVIANSAITEVSLPIALGGTSTSYSISPSLPSGVSFDSNTRVLSGTPITAMDETEFTYTATSGSDTVTLNFDITVEADTVPTYAETFRRVELTAGQEVNVGFPTLTETGNSPISGKTTGPGLGIPGVEVNVFRFGGTVTDTAADDTAGPFSYTRTITDVDGDSGSHTLNFYVIDPIPVAPEISDFTYSTAVTLPEFTTTTSESPALTYSVSGLPQGLMFDMSSRMITGIPSTNSTSTVTYSATDGSDAESTAFALTTINAAPDFGTATIANISILQNSTLATVTLPAVATAGTGATTYSIIPALPLGLEFSANSRELSGVPRIYLSASTFSYVAMDENGDQDTIDFRISVTQDRMPAFAESGMTVNITVGQQINLRYPTPTSLGDEPTTKSVSRPIRLPNLDTHTTERIAGTVFADNSNVNSVVRTYTLTLRDRDGDEARFTYRLNLVDPIPVPPQPTDYTFDIDTEINQTLDGFTTTADGIEFLGNFSPPSLTYSLFGLPDGLNFDAASQTITGMTSAESVSSVTYRATDGADSRSVTFTVTVRDPDPSPDAPSVSDLVHEVGDVVRVILDEFTISDDSRLMHRLTNGTPDGTNDVTALVGGLSYEASSRTISGTVTGTAGDDSAPATTYTYSATEVDDTDPETTSTTFTITITDAMPLVPASMPALTFTVGDANTESLLPFTSGTGGADMLTYALSSASTLPTGLSFVVSDGMPEITGIFNGTSNDDATETPISYTATDTDGDVTPTTFTIAIIDALPLVPAAQPFTFAVGETVNETLSPFTGGTGGTENLRYALATGTLLPSGLMLDATTRALTGIVGGTAMDDATDAPVPYTYSATDSDGDVISTTFTIAITDSIPNFGTATIADISVTQNSAITTVTLPIVMPNTGTGEVGYSFSPSLPMGLTFDADDTFDLSGSPTVIPTQTAFTYTATDEDGDTAPLVFMLTVIEDLRPVIPNAEQISEQNFVFEIGAAVSETLAAYTGGNGTLTYALQTTPALPQGLGFVAGTRVISGTLTADSSNDDKVARTTYTYTATDEDGDDESAAFTIQITDTIPLAPRVNNQSYTVGMEITDLTLPLFSTTTDRVTPNPNFTLTLTDGTDPISDTNTLIAGLMYDVGTRTISGTPNAEVSATTYTYMATDGADTASLTFTIEVGADPVPQAPTVNDLTYSPGDVVSVILDEFTGENGPFMHRLTDGPPNSNNDVTSLVGGLTYEPSTRTISGTVTSTAADDTAPATTYTYSATDSDDTDPDTTSVTFTITIEDSQPVAPQIEAMTFTIGQPLGEDALSPFTGGDGTLTYSLSDGVNPANTLIGGLSFTPADRTIIGTLAGSVNDDTLAATTYTYRAADADPTPDVATTTFTIAIADDMPDISGGSIANIDILQNTELTTVNLPTSTAGTAPITYTLTPALPSGLNFDANLRQISGMPTVALNIRTYTYRATDNDGDISDLMFTIRVEADTAPVVPASPQAIVIAVRDTINESLTRFTGGNGDLTYALATGTTLPLGLSFDAETPAITGIISGTTDDDDVVATSYSYTATDSDIVDPDTTTATFTIAITDAKPVPPTTTPDFVFAVRETLNNRTLPAFTGGTGTLTYGQVSPALPAGLSFDNDADSLALSGTVMGGATDDTTDDPVPYSYTATDADGDVRSATFTIALTDLLPTAPAQPQAYSFTVGVAGSETLVAFDGGDRATSGGELTYALVSTPSLPAGLGFDAPTRVISGTIADRPGDNSVNADVYTYNATDVDGDMIPAMFTIEVEDAVPVAPSPAIQDFVFPENTPITTVTLREFTTTTAHNPSLTHSLSALPSGLSVASDNRTISGTPDALGSTTVTYSVTDGSDTASVTFTIRVVDDPEPQAPTVSNLTYSPGDSVNVILDLFTGGNPPLSHKLTDGVNPVTDLVGGLRYESSSRTISGTVTSTAADDSVAATTYTYSATDSDPTNPDTTPVTFTITIEDSQPVAPQIPNITFTIGQPLGQAQGMDALLPFTGGDGTLTYSLSDGVNPANTLIGGLSFTPADRTITGTLTGSTNDDSVAVTTYTYRAQDSDPTPDVASTTFTITISDVLPDLSGGGIANISVTQNSAITAVTLPQTTGTGTVMYSLSPTLPMGLNFRESTRVLSGTPTVELVMTQFTYTATDADGDTDMLTFTITVEEDLMPVVPSDAQNFVFEPGQTVRETLAVFTGGNGDLTYALASGTTLLDGLSFDGNSRVLSGTLVATDTTNNDDTVSAISYTYTATDTDDDTASATFTLAIIDAIPIVPVVSTRNFAHNAPIPANTLLPPFTTTGDEISSITAPDLAYTLTGPNGGNLPPGVMFEETSPRTLSGTPTQLGDTLVTYTATGGLDSASVTFTISIVDDPMPIGPNIPNTPFVFTPGQVVSVVLPRFTGGNGELTYSLFLTGDATETQITTFDVRLNLSYDSGTRTLSGEIPATDGDDTVAPISYTYTATDSDTETAPDTTPVTFTIAVRDDVPQPPTQPQALTFAVSDEVSSQSLSPFTSGTGGADMLVYALSSDSTLPSGFMLSVDSSNIPQISGNFAGTPNDDTTTGPPPSYTYTATDTDGDVREATFTVAITDAQPDFGSMGIDPITIIQNSDYPETALPMATSGTGELTYSITDAEGNTPDANLLGFDSVNRRLTATPTVAAGVYNLVYRVTDEDGDPDTIEFTVNVVAEIPLMAPTAPQEFIFEPGQTVDASNATLEAFTGGNRATQDAPLTYALEASPALPPPLTFDATTLVLSGTLPADEAGNSSINRTYTYTATDVDGDTEEAMFSIRVVDDYPLVPTTENIQLIVDMPIPDGTQLAEFTTNVDDIPSIDAPALAYTLTGPNGGSLPPGIMFEETSPRTLSGTPTVPGVTLVTYTATAGPDVVPTTFTITVTDDPEPEAPTISNFVFTPGQDLTEENAVMLPAFRITGDLQGLTLTHSLANEAGAMIDNDTISLIGGLSYDQSTRTLSGTVTGTSGDDDVAATTYIYSATEMDTQPAGQLATTTSIRFTITINDEQPVAPVTTIPATTFVVGEPIGGGALPAFTSGTEPLTHSLSDGTNPVNSLIGGLTFNPTDRTITGPVATTTDDDSVDATTYTYRVTDRDGDAQEVTFTIAIRDDIPDFGTATIADIPAIENFAITAVELPQVVQDTGTGEVRYTLEPVIGDTVPGLSFNAAANSRMLTGTPTEVPSPAANDFTYTATDEDGDTVELMFTITVVGNSEPMRPTRPQTFIYAPGQPVDITLDAFIGGNEPIIYSSTDEQAVMDALGLEYTAVARTITGAIATDADGDNSVARTEYTYTATDADGQTATATFSIEVVDAVPVPPLTVGDASFTRGARNTFELPAFTTSVDDNDDVTAPALHYSLSGNPSWLSIDEANHTLSGMPPSDAPLTSHTVTYIARDGADEATADMATVDFTLIVDDDARPIPPAIDGNPFTFVPGDTVSITLDDFTSGDGTLTYSLANTAGEISSGNTLLGGLTYTSTTTSRTLSGMVFGDAMDNSVAATTYTYSATDSDQPEGTDGSDGPDTGMTTITITIRDEMPDFGTVEPIAPIAGTQDEAITTVTLPPVETDGTGTTTYSLTPALPASLMFDPNTRMLSGTPESGFATTFTYTATDADGDTDTIDFTVTIQSTTPTPLTPPTTTQAFTFEAGDPTQRSLEVFTGGNGVLTYAIDETVRALPQGLALVHNSESSDPPMISGTVPNSSGGDSVIATTYTYTATDEDGDTASATFTITITDNNLTVPTGTQAFRFAPGEMGSRALLRFTGGNGVLTYRLNSNPALPTGLMFDDNADSSDPPMISGMIPVDAESMPARTYTYTATDEDEVTLSTTFTIAITDVPSLEEATASAIPTVGANIALVATQAISSRVELALDGLSSGIDIRTLDGPSLRLNPNVNKSQQNGGSSGSPVRFGVWYSAASDSLSDTRSTVTWEGTTDSTNLGFDVGFDISESASLVVGILQNSSSTEATYRNTDGGSAGTLSVDLDSTAFYVGLGYDWLDAWFANGSADSTLNDSETDMAIPASFSYQTIGLTASFEVAESLSIGAKVESLTSDLSLSAMDDVGYDGLQTDSSQLRTAFVANYQLKLGERGNGLLMPKLEFGFRDLSLSTSITEDTVAAVAAVGGSAMETGFGIDYSQMAWGLTLGIDIRSISVENYSSDSTQYQIRWESGNYGSGISFQLTPHSVSETLGGIDSLYSGGYNQYQSVLERQRGGNSTQDSKGMDFEVGYGFVANYGTLTPYLKTTNYRGSGNRAQEFGIRYQTLQGLELSLTAERELTPQTLQLHGFPLTFTQDENALTFNTRYSF